MATMDRVITTQALLDRHDLDTGDLLVAAGLLGQLDPDGLHVLVVSGVVHAPGDDRLVCTVELALTNGTSVETDVLITTATFEGLPTAFQALATAAALIPATAAELDVELAALTEPDEEDA